MLYDEFYWVNPTQYPGALNEAKGIKMCCAEGLCLQLDRFGFGMAPVHINMEDLVNGGGLITHTRWGIRELKLPVVFTGDDQQQLLENVERWTRYFRPVNVDGSPRICRMRRYRADGSVREISLIYVTGMERLETELLRAEGLKTELVFHTEDPFWSDLTTVRYNLFDNSLQGKRIRLNLAMNPDFDEVGYQWAEGLGSGPIPTDHNAASEIITDWDFEIRDILGSTVPWESEDNNVWAGPHGHKIISIDGSDGSGSDSDSGYLPKGRSTSNSWTVEGENFEWDNIWIGKVDGTDEYVTSITAMEPTGTAVMYQVIPGLEQAVQYSCGISAIPIVGRIRMGMNFYNSAYQIFSTDMTPWYDASDQVVKDALAAGYPLVLEHTFLNPEEAEVAMFRIEMAPSVNAVEPYSYALFDKAIIEKGTELGIWFDGNSTQYSSSMSIGWLDSGNAPNSRSYMEPLRKDTYTAKPIVDKDWFPIPLLGFSTYSEPQELSTYNSGHGDAWPTWVINGPVLEIRLTSLELNHKMEVNFNRPGLPESLRLVNGLPAGTSLIIDTWRREMMITFAGGTQNMPAFYYRTPDSRFWPLVPGMNKFTIEVIGTTNESSVHLFYKRRWLNA